MSDSDSTTEPPTISEFFDLTHDAGTIEKSFVADNTTEKYIKGLINFQIWLYFHHREVLEEDVITKMEIEESLDKVENVRPKKKSRYVRKKMRQNDDDYLNMKNLRALCKKMLESVKSPAYEGDIRHRSPIRLTGENSLTYEIIRQYMMLKKKVVLLDKDCVDDYAKSNKNENQVGEEHMHDEKVKVLVQQSISSYQHIRSFIKYLYRATGVSCPLEISNKLSTFIAGKKRVIRKEKQNLGLTITEGKKALSKEGYHLFAKYFFTSSQPEHAFAHLFLVLDWCLMKRAENCVNAQINHIYFRHDALVFEFAKSKGHQKGEDHVGPWHLFANPTDPYICPVLSLSRYLATNIDVMKGDMPLFEGTSQYDRYIGIFEKACVALEPELKKLGYQAGDLGTHSNRKGVATLIASGSTVSPPIAPLCIRAGWVLGGARDKYIFRENAGDMYVGRCASGLDQLSKEFAISPPYFDLSHLKGTEKLLTTRRIWSFLKERIMHYDAMRSETLHLVFMCFATLCFHFSFLKETIHENASLRVSPLFRDIPEDIRTLSVVKHPWNKTEDTPQFSGIPPHVLHLAEMEALRNEIITLRANLKNDIETIMNDRGFATANFNTEQIIAAVTKKQDEAFENLLKKAKLTELADIGTEEEQEQHKYCFDEEIVTTLFDDVVDLTNDEQALKTVQQNKQKTEIMKKRKFTVGLQRGKLTPLPPNFSFPFMTLEQLIFNWCLGNVEENVPPYCTLVRGYLNHDKRLAAKLSMMRALMSVVENIARKHNVWESNISEWTYEKVNKMWRTIGYQYIIAPLTKDSNRSKTLSWKSFYNKMSERNIFNNKKNKHFVQGEITNFFDVAQPKDPPPVEEAKEAIIPIAPTHPQNTNTGHRYAARSTSSSTSRRNTRSYYASRNNSSRTSVGAYITNIHNPTRDMVHVSRALVQARKTRAASDRLAISMANKQLETDTSIVHLVRNQYNQFENCECHNCHKSTNHRCTYRALLGKFYDVANKQRICGQGICNLCAGQYGYEKSNRCLIHIGKDQDEVFD